MALPKLQYIQRFEVHENLVDYYQEFVMKLVEAHKKQGLTKSWTVYENTFKPIRDTREYIFIRELESWSDIDTLSAEQSLAKILIDAFGEKEGMQILQMGKKTIKKISTEVISRIDMMTLKQ